MFTRASLLENLNCVGVSAERSYLVRSADPTKASASSSLENSGRDLSSFILLHLLGVHVAGTDRANEIGAVPLVPGES